VGRPNSEELDPLGPRQAYFEGGYLVTPMLKYYSRKDAVAEGEYSYGVSLAVVKFLEGCGYSAFYVGMVHVGYSKATSVACVVVIANGFLKEDAESLIAQFDSFSCRELKRLFCFRGSSQSSQSESSLENLAIYQTSPDIGSSIGTVGGKSSFSIGMYVRFAEDEEKYWISVHHGISMEQTSTTPTTVPQVVIQQPSANDFNDKKEEYLANLELVRDGPTPRTPHYPKYYLDLLAEMDSLRLPCGVVEYSEMKVVDYGGKPTWSDWCLIKVSRDGMRCEDSNNITFGRGDSGEQFHPRDKTRVYITGTTTDGVGALVLKRGRTSGSAKGIIRFVYDHVRIEGTGKTTSEMTIVSPTIESRFSDLGDSGAPVVDQAGRLVGIVLGGSSGEPIELIGHESLGRVHVSYISPIDLIIDRIREITGKIVHVDIPDLDRLEAAGTQLFRGEFNLAPLGRRGD
jgi:hypothetical protein